MNSSFGRKPTGGDSEEDGMCTAVAELPCLSSVFSDTNTDQGEMQLDHQ